MRFKYQRGLSLLGCAIFFGVLGFAAIAALISMRQERNLFAETWKAFTKQTQIAPAVEQAKQSVQGGGQAASATLRKCIVNGSVVYSNVECDDRNPTSRKVDLHINSGFDAPKVPEKPKEETAQPSMQQKAIDKALQQQ